MARARVVDSRLTPWLGACAALIALACSTHARAQECKTDADCADGYGCDLRPGVSTDCPADAGPCAMAEPSGECEPKKMTCETDSDCVEGLTCAHRSGDSACTAAAPTTSRDAGTAPEDAGCAAPEPSPGECVYQPIECKKDSDCDGDFVCTPLGRNGSCSEHPSTCAPGQDCAAPPEESCTETITSYCFPKPVACKTDDDCAHGTRCAVLPDGAADDPPPGWEGATALCEPEAIALVFERRVEVSGGSSSSSSDAASISREASDNKSQSGSPNQAADDGMNSNGGCAVSTPGARGAAGASLVFLLGVAFSIARRRI